MPYHTYCQFLETLFYCKVCIGTQLGPVAQLIEHYTVIRRSCVQIPAGPDVLLNLCLSLLQYACGSVMIMICAYEYLYLYKIHELCTGNMGCG